VSPEEPSKANYCREWWKGTSTPREHLVSGNNQTWDEKQNQQNQANSRDRVEPNRVAGICYEIGTGWPVYSFFHEWSLCAQHLFCGCRICRE